MWNLHYTTITALEWSLTNHVEFTLHYYNSLGVETHTLSYTHTHTHSAQINYKNQVMPGLKTILTYQRNHKIIS